jgi:hypothetical protein
MAVNAGGKGAATPVIGQSVGNDRNGPANVLAIKQQ